MKYPLSSPGTQLTIAVLELSLSSDKVLAIVCESSPRLAVNRLKAARKASVDKFEQASMCMILVDKQTNKQAYNL